MAKIQDGDHRKRWSWRDSRQSDPYEIDREKLPVFWRNLALPLALILTPVGTWLTTGAARDFMDSPNNTVKLKTVLFLLFGLLAFCLGVYLNVANQRLRTRHAEQEATERRKNLVWINDQLAPVIDTLSDFLSGPRGYDDGVIFVKRVLSDARSLIPFDDVRLCVYRLDRTEGQHLVMPNRDGDDGSEVASFVLDLFAFRGRGDHPRLGFDPSDERGRASPHGRKIISVACGHQAWAVDDYGEYGNSVDRKEGSVWKSFLAVPIVHEKDSLGVLMIDTRDKAHFTHQHISVGWTISKFLGIGLAALKEGGVDYTPEIRDMVRLWNLRNTQGLDLEHDEWEIESEDTE